jgi:hypothetical protein
MKEKEGRRKWHGGRARERANEKEREKKEQERDPVAGPQKLKAENQPPPLC